MSTAAGAPSDGKSAGATSPGRHNKGKGKNTVASPDVSMEEDSDDDEDDEDEDAHMGEEDEDDEEEEEEEEGGEEINPSAIISSGRRTRGIRVDYTSKEALDKAGLKPEEEDSDEDRY